MTEYKKIEAGKLSEFINKYIEKGNSVIAPKVKKEKSFFAKINSYDKIANNYIQTVFSAKSAVFPKCEELFNFENDNGDVNINNPDPLAQQTIVFGSRPCDSAAFDYLSMFFLKENPDFHFKRRFDNTVIISLSCSKSDEHCFCTSVGLSPSNTKGSDILLTNTNDGYYFAEILSEKGKKLADEFANYFQSSEKIDKDKFTEKLDVKFDSSALKDKMKGAFDWEKWEETSLACFGCGTCAFSCPTCTCFDIQDESNLDGGARYRLWDTCALGIFTKHASGHNPREVQSQRWRNRVLHKFQYTNEQFGMLSCVGCGRCSRNCPAGLNITEQVISILEG